MAYRTEVRRFTDTLAAQAAALDRAVVLQKAAPKSVRAGSVSASLFRSAKADGEGLAPYDELVGQFALALLYTRLHGRAPPNMDKLVKSLRAQAKTMKGARGKTLAGIADLGEVTWALPRMWDDKAAPKVTKGYPEYDPAQPRDNGGRFAGGGGAGGGGGFGSSRPHGMGARRAELFDAYRVKFGYYPPKGMTNQRVDMWVRNKAPAGADVTHEVRGALAEYRADEPWSTTFKRSTGNLLHGVYSWAASPLILDTVLTLAFYGLAVNYLPAAASAVGLKHGLNNALNIVLRRRAASSKDLIDAMDGLRGMLRRPRAGWFG